MAFLDGIGDGSQRRKKRPRPLPPVPPPADDDSLPCITFYVNKCPHCGSTKHQVYSNKGNGVRHHICLNPRCGRTFKSIEKVIRN